MIGQSNIDVKEQRKEIHQEKFSKMRPIPSYRQGQVDDKVDSRVTASPCVCHCSALPHGSPPHYPNNSLKLIYFKEEGGWPSLALMGKQIHLDQNIGSNCNASLECDTA